MIIGTLKEFMQREAFHRFFLLDNCLSIIYLIHSLHSSFLLLFCENTLDLLATVMLYSAFLIFELFESNFIIK